MAESEKSRKGKRKYVSVGQSRRSGAELTVGMRGVIVTCNRDERQARDEVFNLLQEYVAAETDEQPDSDEDVSKAVRRECESAAARRPFDAVNSRVNNCLFVRLSGTATEAPSSVVHRLLADAFERRQSRCRHVMRVLPADATCRAAVDELGAALPPLLARHFAADTLCTYAVAFKSRNQSALSNSLVTEMVGDMVRSVSPLARVHLSAPDLTVLVETLGSVCCLAVVRDYNRFCRYNLHQIGQKPVDKVEEAKLVVSNLAVDDSS